MPKTKPVLPPSCRQLLLAGILSMLCSSISVSAAREIIGWNFDKDTQGWHATRHIEELEIRDGTLSGKTMGHDPQLGSPLFDIPATPYQEFHARIRCDKPGKGQLFYSNTTEGQYGGFSGDKVIDFTVQGTGDWEIVSVRPWWQAEKRIIQVRFDLYDEVAFSIDWLRIVEPGNAVAPDTRNQWEFPEAFSLGWKLAGTALSSPPLKTDLTGRDWLILGIDSPTESHIKATWATTRGEGLQERELFVTGDTVPHWYSLDMTPEKGWSGELLYLTVTGNGRQEMNPRIVSIAVAGSPREAPDPLVTVFAPENALNRVDEPCAFLLRIRNLGEQAIQGIQARVQVTRETGEVLLTDQWELDAGPEPVTRRIVITPRTPGTRIATLTWSTGKETRTAVSLPMQVQAKPKVQSPGTIPEPQPAETRYLIGSYYYPGFGTDYQWRQLEQTAPEAKPVLGYYDEGNPECVDWQIKWAVEHGIRFFLIDWYWVAGRMHHTHYIEALKKSRFRSYMKWAVMWANHNPPNTHSEADWRAVTTYWIENFFNMPEYLTVEGKPLVAIWSPGNIRKDMKGSDEAGRLLDISRKMAQDAGYPGIHFVAMNNNGSPAQLASEGYAVWTSYHWWSDSTTLAADPRYFPFSLVVDRSRKAWDERFAQFTAAGLDMLPVADTGWDARPRHGDHTLVIYERTPEQFERLLRQARQWLDEHNRNTLVLGPWNEWTEGSYIEPCAEFGFGMLQAVHRVFCEGGQPEELGPADTGLGPYDFDLSRPGAKKSLWAFTVPEDAAAWRPFMGLGETRVENGALHSTTTTHDPAFQSERLELAAATCTGIQVTIRIQPAPPAGDTLVVFWATSTMPINGRAHVDVPLKATEDFQTVTLDLSKQPRWRGSIRYLRLDPCGTAGREIAIREIRLLP